MNDFDKRFNKIVTDKLSVSQKILTTDSEFIKDLGANMLDMVELMLEYENEFNVSIPDSVADQIVTVGDMKAYLRRAMTENQQNKIRK